MIVNIYGGEEKIWDFAVQINIGLHVVWEVQINIGYEQQHTY